MTDELLNEMDAIVPDDRDWTWVTERACPDCGFDGAAFVATDVSAAIRRTAEAWGRVLERPAGQLRERRDPARWTELEYAAHVRDVFRLYLVRLRLMLEQDDPMYPNWDQDETARAERYNEMDPEVVGAELRSAADDLAVAFDAVSGADWQRRGRRSDGASFTIDSFARYLVHDPIHHLVDVGELSR